MGFDSVTFYVDGTILRIDDEWPYSAIFTPVEEGNYTIAVVTKMTSTTKFLCGRLCFLSVGTPSGGARVVCCPRANGSFPKEA